MLTGSPSPLHQSTVARTATGQPSLPLPSLCPRGIDGVSVHLIIDCRFQVDPTARNVAEWKDVEEPPISYLLDTQTVLSSSDCNLTSLACLSSDIE